MNLILYFLDYYHISEKGRRLEIFSCSVIEKYRTVGSHDHNKIFMPNQQYAIDILDSVGAMGGFSHGILSDGLIVNCVIQNLYLYQFCGQNIVFSLLLCVTF